jgi:hypothetical protein
LTPIICAHISDPLPGSPTRTSVVQIWNPSNSGVDFFLECVECAWTATSATITAINGYNGFDFNYSNTAISATGLRNFRLKIASVSGPSSPIEMRIETPATLPGGVLIGEMWAGSVGKGHRTLFTSPIKVPPGAGFLVRPGQPNLWTIVNAEGYTVPVD